MQDLYETRANIEKLNTAIAQVRHMIGPNGEKWAKAIKQYKMRRAITTAIISNQDTYELHGKIYKKPPVTLVKSIVEGIVADEEEAMKKAETAYRACIDNLDALKAQLNSQQSIFRHLE